ncbi:1385_t:CDS:1, partial [Gigaspora margarita]
INMDDDFFNHSFDNISNMSESFDSINELFEISNAINDSFNTVASISDNSNTTSQTPTLDIIDESSNTSKSIWDYFNKVKENNK